MATSQKVFAPQPAAFTSDPTEQIFSKGMLDRDMSGLSYMMLNAMQGRRESNQENYMAGVQEANRIAAALAQQETLSKQAMETLKQAVEMSKGVGTPTDSMPIMRLLMPDGRSDPGAAAKLAVLQSEAEANRAKAAAVNAPEFSTETAITPSGVSQEILRAKQKGGDAALLQEMARQRALQAMRNRGIQGSGPGGTGLPNANPVDVQRTQDYMRSNGRWGQ